MANSQLAIGVDVGGTKVLGGVVDTSGKILRTFREETPLDGGDALNRTIAKVIVELQKTHDTSAVGISAAGCCFVGGGLVTASGGDRLRDVIACQK